MPRLARTLVALTLIASPALTFAASGETVTGSGSVADVPSWNALLTSLAPYQSEGTLSAEGLFSAETEKALTLITDRRTAARQTCRTHLHKASATTRFGILSGCFQDDLAAEDALIARMASALKAITILETAPVLTTIEAESDALGALIDGVDSHLYASEADLQKARQRLVQKYITPRWLSLTKLRADLGLRWSATEVAALSLPPSGSGAVMTAPDATLIDCFNQSTELLLKVRTATDRVSAQTDLQNGLQKLASCQAPAKSVE